MYNRLLKIFLVLTLSFIFSAKCLASQMLFNNENYLLRYSDISPHTKGYFNEYTRKNETIHNWTKLIIVHYYPDPKCTPFSKSTELRKLINENKNSKLIGATHDKETGVYTVSFVVTGSENNAKYLEYNIFKYEKAIRNGVHALQYSQRYPMISFTEIPSAMDKVNETEEINVELMMKTPMPKLVERKIGL